MSIKSTGRKWAVAVSAAAIAVVALSAAVAYAARDGSDEPEQVVDDVGYDTVSAPAPIEGVTIDGKVVRIVSVQATGCDQFEGYDLTRDGNDVVITVTNRVPAQEVLPVVLCAMEYRTTTSAIDLGDELSEGETYRVVVNGELAAEFTA